LLIVVLYFSFQKESLFVRRQDFQLGHGIQARHDLATRKRPGTRV
jgi:hypothetical protein